MIGASARDARGGPVADATRCTTSPVRTELSCTPSSIVVTGFAATVWRRVGDKGGIAGRTVTLKVKYQDFQIVTRSRSLDRAVAGRDEFLEIGIALLRTVLPSAKGIRLLGLTLSNLGEEGARKAEMLEPALPL